MRSESLQIWSSEITPSHALVLPNRIRESCLLNKWSCFHQQDVCHRPGVILRTPHSMQRWIFNFLSDFCHYFRLLGNKNVKKIFSDIPQCLSPRYSLSQFYSKNSSHYHVSWRGARGRRQYAKVGEEGGGVNFLVAAFLHFSILFKTKYLSLFPWKSDASES